jgi:hypothetical protein
MEVYGRKEVQLLLILNLGTRWGWVVSVTPWPRFTPGKRTPGTHWIEGWVGPRAGLDAGVRRKILCLCRGSKFLVERYLKTELFKTTQSDYSHQLGCPAPAKSVIWKFVKQSRQTGNANILKCIHWSTVVTETHIAEVSERLSASPHKSLQTLEQQTGMSYSSCCKAVKTM